MANRDDVTREVAECVECGSIYAARVWPGGDIQTIGSNACSCGSTEFEIVEDVGDDVPSSDDGLPMGGASGE
jgi:hypothetical protein